ncbi:MAG: extracellular solute-binding protein [bacterium]|nr:extracellular solute-binding protein [bacterium]
MFYFLLIFGLFIFAFCLSSCGLNNKVSGITFWSSSLKPYFTDYIEGIIKNFEEIYGIEVNWQDYPIDSIYQKMLTNFGTDLSPDVVNINPQLAAGLYKQGMIVDIMIYDRDIEHYFHSNLIEGCKIGNELITIPWYSSTKMLIYNKKIFDFSKVEIRDYEEFFDVVRKIRQEKGVYGFYPFLKFEQDMLGLGLIGDPDDPFNDQVIKFFTTLRKNRDYLPSGFLVSSVDVAYSMYKDGKVASILIGPQFLYRIKKESPELYASTSVILFPFKNYPVTMMSLSVVNNRDLERISNSLKFIKFLTNFENQNRFFQMVPVLPSVKGNYSVEDQDDLIRSVKKEMIKLFPKGKVFDLYFYNVIPDPVVRSNIFKNFMNDVFSNSNSMEYIQQEYRKKWIESKK